MDSNCGAGGGEPPPITPPGPEGATAAAATGSATAAVVRWLWKLASMRICNLRRPGSWAESAAAVAGGLGMRSDWRGWRRVNRYF